MTLAVLAGGVGRPDVAFAVHMEAVRAVEHSGAEARQELAGGIELHDRRQVRTHAVVAGAAIERPDAAVRTDIDADGRAPFAAVRQLRPARLPAMSRF